MINRSIMKRQMFKAGGAAFPDLSGDGKVTQKDILMGRGVQFMERGTEVMDNQELARRMKERLFQDYMRRENEQFREEFGLDRVPTMEQRERIERIRKEQMTPEQENYIRREQVRQLLNYPEGMHRRLHHCRVHHRLYHTAFLHAFRVI